MNPDADNAELRSWLWKYSERVTGIRFPIEASKAEDSFDSNKIYKDRNSILKQART